MERDALRLREDLVQGGGLQWYIFIFHLSWMGDRLWGCQMPWRSSPSSIFHPDGAQWCEWGQRWRAMGKSRGNIHTWWKTPHLQERSARREGGRAGAQRKGSEHKRQRKKDKANRVQCLTFHPIKSIHLAHMAPFLYFCVSLPSFCNFIC